MKPRENVISPYKGLRFYHSRIVNWDNEKTPALFQVTRIAQGQVYYRAVYDAGEKSERLGQVEQCGIEYWPKVFLHADDRQYFVTESSNG